jgi:urease accessory protein UreH
VFAFASNNVWAVGTYDGPGGMRTLIMHYTGGALEGDQLSRRSRR